ncbi:hypothetical protein, partial [Klebsiella variicola]|uniref:hypothetical protein n=1 Tax=Klebsiella variicola TaxID=244366 RepID=UPI001C57C37C
IYTNGNKTLSNNNRLKPLTNLKLITQKVVLFYCASDRQHRKIRNFPGINIHHFYINEAQVSASLRIISCCGTLFIFK